MGEMKALAIILVVIIGVLLLDFWLSPPVSGDGMAGQSKPADAAGKEVISLEHAHDSGEVIETPLKAAKVAGEDRQAALIPTPGKPALEVVAEVAAGQPQPTALESASTDAPPVIELEARILVGHQAVDSEVLDRDLEKVIKTSQWQAYHDQLHQSLVASIDLIKAGPELDPYVSVWHEKLFYQVLLRWRVMNALPPSLWVASSDYSYTGDLARWMFHQNEAMEELLLTIDAHDSVAEVFPLLSRLWGSHEEKSKLGPKYFNLALACAVVFDRQIAYTTPDEVSGTIINPDRRYQWYVNKNESGLLEVSIDRSTARDLVFVVASPVTEKELDWAVKNCRSKKRKAWGGTFGEVRYLMERAVEGLNPYESYTLEQILKEGGICGDQSYFCVNTARAAGIPAFGLSGVTNAGGHAWAAVKLDPDEWSTAVGRIGGVSQGRGGDPQTGQAITEQEVWMWSSRDYRSRSTQLKVNRHFWLADFMESQKRTEDYAKAVRAAHRFGKMFPEVWEYVYRLHQNDPQYTKAPTEIATLDRWRDFASEIRQEFKENPRMAALAIEVESKHVFPHAELNDARRDLMRERRRQQRAAGEQTDLVVASIRRESELILEKDKVNALREISQLYDSAFKDYGSSVTGFQTMADDYFNFMKADQELARKSVRDIELAFKRLIDTGSTDWFRAKTEVGLHRRICEMYRQVGEEKMADNMEKRLERQMEKAKRGAL